MSAPQRQLAPDQLLQLRREPQVPLLRVLEDRIIRYGSCANTSRVSAYIKSSSV